MSLSAEAAAENGSGDCGGIRLEEIPVTEKEERTCCGGNRKFSSSM